MLRAYIGDEIDDNLSLQEVRIEDSFYLELEKHYDTLFCKNGNLSIRRDSKELLQDIDKEIDFSIHKLILLNKRYYNASTNHTMLESALWNKSYEGTDRAKDKEVKSKLLSTNTGKEVILLEMCIKLLNYALETLKSKKETVLELIKCAK